MGQTLCDLLPCQIINFISNIITLIKVAVPVLIIIFGMLDLGKSVISNKEEDIKKHRSIFMRRVLTGAIVFFVGVITEFMLTIVNPQSLENQCVKQILTNDVKTCIDDSIVGY